VREGNAERSVEGKQEMKVCAHALWSADHGPGSRREAGRNGEGVFGKGGEAETGVDDGAALEPITHLCVRDGKGNNWLNSRSDTVPA
jgi:hypothetical protein